MASNSSSNGFHQLHNFVCGGDNADAQSKIIMDNKSDAVFYCESCNDSEQKLYFNGNRHGPLCFELNQLEFISTICLDKMDKISRHNVNKLVEIVEKGYDIYMNLDCGGNINAPVNGLHVPNKLVSN